MTEPALPTELFEKHFYRVGEVAKVVGVEPHVIRYWERESRIVRTKKNGAGQRVFSRRDVERLLALKQLVYGEGYTLMGAVRQLALGRKVDEDQESQVATLQLDVGHGSGAAATPVRNEELRRGLEATRADLVQFLAWLGDGTESPREEIPDVVPARRHDRDERHQQGATR